LEPTSNDASYRSGQEVRSRRGQLHQWVAIGVAGVDRVADYHQSGVPEPATLFIGRRREYQLSSRADPHFESMTRRLTHETELEIERRFNERYVYGRTFLSADQHRSAVARR
jgi:hypothetical protein